MARMLWITVSPPGAFEGADDMGLEVWASVRGVAGGAGCSAALAAATVNANNPPRPPHLFQSPLNGKRTRLTSGFERNGQMCFRPGPCPVSIKPLSPFGARKACSEKMPTASPR